MKQIIKKQTHYSLLLLRDDREVRSLRIRTGILRFCLFLCFLLPVCTAAGIAAGWHYWKKSNALAARYLLLEQELVETKRGLEQLTNESVLWRNGKSAAPALKNEELGTAAPQQTASVPAPPTPDILAPLHTPAADNPSPPAGTAAIPASNDAMAMAGKPAWSPVPPPPSNGLAAPPIEISGFAARITGGQRLRLRYAIVSPSQRPLVGVISYRAQFSDGTSSPLESLSPEERFNITRMKVVEKQVKLPQGMHANAIRQITQIDLLIELEDNSKVLKSFPML